jgi:PPM family protein phosphatase
MNFFHCRSAATSVQGRRPSNQDAVMDVKLPDGRHLVAVADGMGGHRSGEVASAMALEVLVRELRGGARLHEAVAAANTQVFDEANRDPARAGMGTTLIALLRTDAVYEIANVGDSRAYRIDQHGINRVSRDHSFAEEAASKALMGPEEIARSPWRNALTRSIGTQETVEIDVFGPFEIAGRPHTVMLCSDGLYRALSDDAAWHHLIGSPDPAAGARILIDLALRHGSDDNVSVAVVQFEGASSPIHATRPARVPVRSGAGTAQLQVQPRAASLPLTSQGRQELSPWRPPVRPSLFRRSIGLVFSDNVLFGLCTGILMMWLALRLING